ncbi:hypothetical protein BJ875DRAFT_421251 [Amylocarpus encephaloides]|uniref:Uncharacterized protein n=1 Tax=Amylocarpus encephaloides TaxID=45428 RepID=A0A9P8C6M3_9HELO|nr:hypothetical protein BJ875DRAFT_421251 [Amylocarpus encephaloides]
MSTINWSTVAPDTRLYKGKSLFRWEVSPGLVDVEEEAIEDEGLKDTPDHKDSLYVKSPFAMTPRQRKVMKKFHTPIKYSSFRGGSQRYTPDSGKKSNLYGGVDPAVFFRLGIEVVDPSINSKTRKELIAKLVAAVKEDLEIMEREDRETALREEGFRRWAGKTALHHMNATREGIDWATGQKKSARIEGASETVAPEGFTDIPNGIKNTITEEPAPTPAKVASFPPLTPIKGPTRLPVRTPTLRILATPSKHTAAVTPISPILESPAQSNPPRKPLQPVVNSSSKHKCSKTISDFKSTKVVTQACARVYGKPIMWSKAISTDCTETSNVLPVKPIQAAEKKSNKLTENDSDGGSDGEWEMVVRYKQRAQGNQLITGGLDANKMSRVMRIS